MSQPPQSVSDSRWAGLLPDLPVAYDENRVHLMVIDSFGVLALWDFSEIIEKAVVERVPPPQKKLIRVFDVTKLKATEGALSWDISLDLETTHLIFEMGQPGREFIIAVGYVGADNRFHELGQSNRVRLPQNAPAKKNVHRFGHWDSQVGAIVEEGPNGEDPTTTENGTPIKPVLEAFLGGRNGEVSPHRNRERRLIGPAQHWRNFSRRTPADTSTSS